MVFFFLLSNYSLLLFFLLRLARTLSSHVIILSTVNTKFLFIAFLLLFCPVEIRSSRLLVKLFKLVLLEVLLAGVV